MPTPNSIITTVSALMNDSAQSVYNNTSVLPYFNLALDILQEIYELNGIPVTNRTTPSITVKAGVKRISYDTSPSLPGNLIEIQQLWESQVGQINWFPMTKREFIPHYLEDNTLISQFLIWAWKDQAIELIPSNTDNDLKIDCVSSIFNTPIPITQININLPYTNIKTYLEFETAALCAMFIAENESRSVVLNGLASQALERALGIPIKGMQNIMTRRRPFRAAFRTRGVL